jgi:prenyltransferase beta subunit
VNFPCEDYNEEDIRFTYCALAIRELFIYEMILYVYKEFSFNKHSEFIYEYYSNHSNQSGERQRNGRLYVYYTILKEKTDFYKKIKGKELLTSLFTSIKSYDNSFSLYESCESHSGIVFCSVSSIIMIGNNFSSSINLSHSFNWLLKRLTLLGVTGRINKEEDTCYAFWVLASLINLLKCNVIQSFQQTTIEDWVDVGYLKDFLYECQSENGGFVKNRSVFYRDILHSYYSLFGLKILSNRNDKCFDSVVGIVY